MKRELGRKILLSSLVVVGIVLLAIVFFVDRRIDPVSMQGVRETSNNRILLNFSAIKESSNFDLKDRTIMHFDIGPLLGDFSGSTLNIGVLNLDAGPPPGVLNVFTFAGDGTVSTDQFAVGSLYHSFSNITGATQTLSVDISELLKAAHRNGDSFVSFNLRAPDTDRYSLQSTIDGATQASGLQFAGGVEGPTFIGFPYVIVFEPDRLALFGLAVLMGGLVVVRLMRGGRTVTSDTN